MATVLGGPAEVSLNGVTIPAQLLSEVTVELTEGTRERTTLGGNFTRPSGVLETAQVAFTMYLESMDALKDIFPGRYNAATAPQESGNIILGNDSCANAEISGLNIHYTCETTDDNDVYIYNAQVAMNFNPTYNDSDDLTVEVTAYAQPDAEGRIARIGTGDLTARSVFDPATGQTVPVTS